MIFTLNVSEIECLRFMTSHYITRWGSVVIGAMNRIQKDLNAASDLCSSHYSLCISCSSGLGKINDWPYYLLKSSLVKLSCYSDLSLVTLFLPLGNQFRQRWKALILCLSLILVGGLLLLLIKVLHGQHFLLNFLTFALMLLKTVKYNCLSCSLLHAEFKAVDIYLSHL